ncbi:MAG: ABC transporter ATP-binding protein [Treponema sp.]|jgi:energy-coupling factor transport system ATP-binding protein|nr:ABC transporter ATP-binding protein [Treponema sp.]
MPRPVVEFENFSFRYKAQKEPTLTGITLTVYEGEKVLILGASGSGKSTLANCINGLIPFAYEGEVSGSCRVNGREAGDLSIFELSHEVGTVLQDTDAQFVGLSVGEDVAFAMENSAMDRDEMLVRVVQNCREVGMESFLGALPFSLSGGQKQRAALAGVLDKETTLLIFDEPLASLDPRGGMSAIDLINRISKNHTIIIIEHRLEDVLYRPVDRVVLLDQGQIVSNGGPAELLKSGALNRCGIREPLYLKAMKYARCSLDDIPGIPEGGAFELPAENSEKLRIFFEKEAPRPAEERTDEIIRVENLSFTYEESPAAPALRSVSLAIHRGESVAVIGKNGAGKSTLAKLLCGIVRPTEGTIFLKGENISSLSIREIACRTGYVMQDPNQMIVKDIVRDEVEFALRLREFSGAEIERRTREALRTCDLYGMRNWPVEALSYGQKKRVTIASVLALEPEIIILDEPTAGQDYRRYTEIMTFIGKLNRDYGKTMILITHDMHLALEEARRALVFADGSLIADGPVYSILADSDTVEKAHLKMTSLHTLAESLGMSGRRCIEAYINHERAERALRDREAAEEQA